ncbi:MAG: hypothetical protein M1833_002583 [Piccolia ochrophora]|nr:MAG: hypothetical protein M1833_002583 [Piccolia ochrophora]
MEGLWFLFGIHVLLARTVLGTLYPGGRWGAARAGNTARTPNPTIRIDSSCEPDMDWIDQTLEETLSLSEAGVSASEALAHPQLYVDLGRSTGNAIWDNQQVVNIATFTSLLFPIHQMTESRQHVARSNQLVTSGIFFGSHLDPAVSFHVKCREPVGASRCPSQPNQLQPEYSQNLWGYWTQRNVNQAGRDWSINVDLIMCPMTSLILKPLDTPCSTQEPGRRPGMVSHATILYGLMLEVIGSQNPRDRLGPEDPLLAPDEADSAAQAWNSTKSTARNAIRFAQQYPQDAYHHLDSYTFLASLAWSLGVTGDYTETCLRNLSRADLDNVEVDGLIREFLLRNSVYTSSGRVALSEVGSNS